MEINEKTNYEISLVKEEVKESIKNTEIITIKLFAERLIKRVKKDKDAVIAITGEEGDGKSTMANWLIIWVLKLLGKNKEEIILNLNDYILYSPNEKELTEKIKSMPKYHPINADEAIKILYKLNWASAIQRYLNMLYAICRQENLITILCMPRFTDFNEFFRNHRIKYWIHILDRGVAVLFSKDWNPFNSDPWFIYESNKFVGSSYKKYTKVIDFNVGKKINVLTKLKTFVARIDFKDMPKEIEKVYKEGKQKNTYENMYEKASETLSKNEKMWKERTIRSINFLSNSGLKPKQIASTLDMPYNAVIKFHEDKLLPNANKLENKTSPSQVLPIISIPLHKTQVKRRLFDNPTPNLTNEINC